MSHIQRLTDAQIAKMPEWVEKWVSIGLSTERANFAAAEAGVRGCYRAAKLKEPKIVLRMDSPLGAVFGGCVAVQLLKGVRLQVWSQVWSQVQSQVQSQVESQVKSQVGSQVWSQVWSHWSNYRGGNLWSSWYAYISFLRDVCGWNASSLAAFSSDEQHAVNASWCWYHDEVAALSDRPLILSRNDRGQLHSETGMALQYGDGWGLWRLRGVAVDEQIVMRPNTQTIEQIRGEKNEEIKRLRIERFGWARYLNEINAQRIDSRRNDIEGTRESLYRADGYCVLLCACPSTAKVFALECPPQVNTCRDAQSYLSSGLSSRIISAA